MNIFSIKKRRQTQKPKAHKPRALSFALSILAITNLLFACDSGLLDAIMSDTENFLASRLSVKLNDSIIYNENGTVSFADTPLGIESAIYEFDLTNTGETTLHFIGSKLALSGTGSSHFFIQSPPPDQIAPGESGTFSIGFKPSAFGIKYATATLTSDNPGIPEYSFSLQGKANGWLRTFDGTGDIQLTTLIPFGSGAYAYLGHTNSFTAKSSIFIGALNAGGQVQWQYLYDGGDTDDNPGLIGSEALKACADGGLISAFNSTISGYSTQIKVLKLNASGVIEWQRHFGGASYDYVNSILETSDGGYILAGSTYSYGAGDYDGWVVKLNSSGSIAWQKAIGGSGADTFKHIIEKSTGGFIAVGNTKSFSSDGYDAFVIELSSSGGIVNANAIGDSFDNSIDRVLLDGVNLILAGQTKPTAAASYDLWFISLPSTMTAIALQKSIGGSNLESLSTFEKDATGYLAGATTLYGTGSDSYNLRLNSILAPSWQKTYGTIDLDFGYGIRVDPAGGYISYGLTSGYSASGDAFILRLDPDANPSYVGGALVLGQVPSYGAANTSALIRAVTPTVTTSVSLDNASTTSVSGTVFTNTMRYPLP